MWKPRKRTEQWWQAYRAVHKRMHPHNPGGFSSAASDAVDEVFKGNYIDDSLDA